MPFLCSRLDHEGGRCRKAKKIRGAVMGRSEMGLAPSIEVAHASSCLGQKQPKIALALGRLRSRWRTGRLRFAREVFLSASAKQLSREPLFLSCGGGSCQAPVGRTQTSRWPRSSAKRAHRIVPQSRWMATMSFDDFPDLYYFDLRHQSKSCPNSGAPDRLLDVFQSPT